MTHYNFETSCLSNYTFLNIVVWILLQKVCEFEEKESKSRNIVVDSEIFFDIVREAQSNLDQVKDAKLAQKKVYF